MADDEGEPRVMHPERGDGPARMRTRRIAYAALTAGLCGLMVLAVLDVFAPVLGVDSDTITVQADDGSTLRVEYTTLTRPALASPLSIEVERQGGFDGPIEIAVSRPWIEVWDENGMYPTPSKETGDEAWVVYEFDPPDGNTFRFFYDARLEPAQQTGVEGAVELRDGQDVLARVALDTKVRP